LGVEHNIPDVVRDNELFGYGDNGGHKSPFSAPAGDQAFSFQAGEGSAYGNFTHAKLLNEFIFCGQFFSRFKLTRENFIPQKRLHPSV
jgi:hypothetical protein